MNPELRRAVTEAIGLALARDVELRRSSPIAGGDINDAYVVELVSGERYFVKANGRAPTGMFAAEARGLDWLRETGALRVPRVVACGGTGASDVADAPAFLVLEYLTPSSPRSDFSERLGRGLAALHRFDSVGAHAVTSGFEHDNFIGTLNQCNTPCRTWSDFYRERRLEPLALRARAHGLLREATLRDFERLYVRLDQLVGPAEPLARLHGDLWGGNLHRDERGEPVLIDPAAYRGHREIDLAMMQLFGGFEERVFDAYREAHALADDHASRVSLYQLYPLLVHVNLFGASFVPSVERALSQYV